uniref:Serpin domain-containing protein n=1 Tax=Leersia perrieri TaxID=77586 RepID=A0A0D9XQK5_9ORYZ
MQSWSDRMIACHDGFKVLKLPYKDDEYYKNPDVPRFSMCIFLPTARDGLAALIDKIAADEGFLLRHLPSEHVAVDRFLFPKFTLSFSGSVVDVLKEFGAPAAVRPEERRPVGHGGGGGGRPRDGEAVCQGRCSTRRWWSHMFVRDVFHKAVVEVSEEGSVAAAVTFEYMDDDTCAMEDSDDELPRVDSVADHPFAFFVVEERSRVIVFAGQVLDPSQE